MDPSGDPLEERTRTGPRMSDALGVEKCLVISLKNSKGPKEMHLK